MNDEAGSLTGGQQAAPQWSQRGGAELETASGAGIGRFERLGFVADPGPAEDYLALVEAAIAEARPLTVLSQNLHSLNFVYRDPAFRAAQRRAWVHVDGMPVIWLLRLLGCPVARRQRWTWVDFVGPLFDLAERRGWRVYYLGAEPEILSAGLERVRARWPKLQIDGADGYFDAAPAGGESRDRLARILDHGPHVLLVGMGMPRQERWIEAYRERLGATVVFGCGATIEYLAGALPVAPRWMGRWGLEWLHRLSTRPHRFAKRYLVEPWVTLALVLRYLASGGHPSRED